MNDMKMMTLSWYLIIICQRISLRHLSIANSTKMNVIMYSIGHEIDIPHSMDMGSYLFLESSK